MCGPRGRQILVFRDRLMCVVCSTTTRAAQRDTVSKILGYYQHQLLQSRNYPDSAHLCFSLVPCLSSFY